MWGTGDKHLVHPVWLITCSKKTLGVNLQVNGFQFAIVFSPIISWITWAHCTDYVELTLSF